MKSSESNRPPTDHLLSIKEVAQMMSLCEPVASKLIDESGRAIVTHRRKWILESALYEYLTELAGNHVAR